MGNRGRWSAVLAVLAALALLAGLITGYASLTLFDSDEFSERATAALEDDAVKAEIGRRVTDDLVLRAQADLVAFRPLIESVVEGIVGAGVFRDLVQTAVRDVHGGLVEGNQNTATLTLADAGVVIRGALQALAPQLSKQIGGGADIEVTPIEPPSWFTKIVQAGHDLGGLALILLALGLVLAAVAIWRSPDRRRTLLTFGIAVVGAGVIAAVALGVVRTLLLARIDDTGTRDAGRAIWDAYLGDLRNGLYLFAACGAVLAAAASSLAAPGRRRGAPASRLGGDHGGPGADLGPGGASARVRCGRSADRDPARRVHPIDRAADRPLHRLCGSVGADADHDRAAERGAPGRRDGPRPPNPRHRRHRHRR